MAEPFSIVAGAINITSAFNTCINSFEYVRFCCHFRRDFETSQLALNCARLRLMQWSESVNIYDDLKLYRQNTTATEIQLTKDALLQILVLFADAESISKKYKLTAKADKDLSANSSGDIDPKMVAGLLLKTFSNRSSHSSTGLRNYFPAPQAQTTLVQ